MGSTGKRSPRLLTGMLVLAIFFSMASRAVFSPLMPALQQDMGFGLSAAGTLFLLVSVTYGAAMLLAGFLSARIGHGKTVVAALLAMTLGLVVAAFAPGIPLLATGMLLIGAGAGTYPPSGIALINTRIDIRSRNSALSFHEIGPNLAMLLSPLIVLALQPAFGIRGVLLWVAGACLVAALAFLRWAAPGDEKGATPNIRRLTDILLMRDTLVAILILSATLAGLQGVYAILPAYLVSEHSLDQDYVNLVLAISRIAGVLLLTGAAAIIRWFGRRRMMMYILLFSALCAALLGLVRDAAITVVVILQPTLLSIMFPPILSSVAELGEQRYQNLTYAVIITFAFALGAGAAPAFLGYFAERGLGWIGFTAVAVWMIAAAFFLRLTPGFGRGDLASEG